MTDRGQAGRENCAKSCRGDEYEFPAEEMLHEAALGMENTVQRTLLLSVDLRNKAVDDSARFSGPVREDILGDDWLLRGPSLPGVGRRYRRARTLSVPPDADLEL